MSIKHLDNEEGNKIMTIIICLLLTHGVSKENKAKEDVYATETFMVMGNYLTTFTLYSLSFILWDLDPQIVAFL